jgi:hypothetical protein
VRFSEHQIGRLERLFGQTFPNVVPTEEQQEQGLRDVQEAMRHATPDQATLFEVRPDGVYTVSDGRQIVNTVQMFAEELYADELEGPSEFEHDEDTEAFYHPEHGDMVLSRHSYNLSLLYGGNRRGMYASPYALGPDEHRGGGVVAFNEDL